MRQTMLRRAAEMAIFVILIVSCMAAASSRAGAADDIEWQEYADNPVYEQPAGRAYYPCVLYDASRFSGRGAAYHYRMWYGDTDASRWEWVVYSNDGINWEGPEEITGIEADGYHAVVVYVEEGYGAGPYFFKIWYWDAYDQDGRIQIYTIDAMRTADSADGVTWVNDAALTQDAAFPLVTGVSPHWNRGTYGPLSVHYNPDATNTGAHPFDYTFAMYYDATTGGLEVIGLGYSADGNHWTRYGDDPVLGLGEPGDWDSNYASSCTVIRKSADEWHMWFSGGQVRLHEGIGYAHSTDGINWTKDPGNPLIHRDDGVAWREDRTYTPSVVFCPARFAGNGDASFYKMWFTGRDAGGRYTIGYMSSLDPELALAKAAVPAGEVEPGQEIAYTLSVFNQGTRAAEDSVLLDALPALTAYVPGSTTLNGAAVADVDGASPLQAGMPVNSPEAAEGVIAPAGEAVVTFKVTVDHDAPDGSDIYNYAAATCAGDPHGATAQTINRVSATAPEITLEKTAVPAGEVVRGSVITYTLRMRNVGNGPVTAAMLRDEVPAFTSYVRQTTTLNGAAVADVDGASPLQAGMPVNSPGAAEGVIAPAGEAVVTFTVQAGNDLLPGSSVTNTATGTADGTDPVVASYDNPAPPGLPSTWYFAEGSTQEGFDEYLLLSNMGDADMEVTITYITESGKEKDFLHPVPARSRSTVYVNAAMPGEAGVAAIVAGDRGLICERSMYFRHNGINGGDNTIGANAPSVDLFFAEGFTGTPESPFDEWILLLNPNHDGSAVTIEYLFPDGEAMLRDYFVPGRSRVSIYVDEEVGEGREVSARIRCEQPLVAERSMYFTYNGAWQGGHTGMAATGARSDWYLAEGYTGWEGSRFDEWILVANDNDVPASVTITYMFPDGSTRESGHTAAARSRLTVSADAEVGEGQEVSAHIHSDVPVVVERAMYFDYRNAWQGGHISLGAPAPASQFYFAEGYTGSPASQFETWVLIQNISDTARSVRIDYFLATGEVRSQELSLPARSRNTIFTNEVLARDSLEFSIRVSSVDGSPVILAERAMYFSYSGPMGSSQGGHDVLGYQGCEGQPPRAHEAP